MLTAVGSLQHHWFCQGAKYLTTWRTGGKRANHSSKSVGPLWRNCVTKYRHIDASSRQSVKNVEYGTIWIRKLRYSFCKINLKGQRRRTATLALCERLGNTRACGWAKERDRPPSKLPVTPPPVPLNLRVDIQLRSNRMRWTNSLGIIQYRCVAGPWSIAYTNRRPFWKGKNEIQ